MNSYAMLPEPLKGFSCIIHAYILPVGFWIISLVGSGIIMAYACFRLEPVLIIGQSVGFVTYSRNIVLCIKNKR